MSKFCHMPSDETMFFDNKTRTRMTKTPDVYDASLIKEPKRPKIKRRPKETPIPAMREYEVSDTLFYYLLSFLIC